MRRALTVFFFLAASVTALACQEDEKRPPAASDLGQPSGGGAGGGGGGGGGDSGVATDAGTDAGTACHTLTNDGNVVERERIVGEPPPAIGGTIADGTYELTVAQVYVAAAAGVTAGPTGELYQGVLRVSNQALRLERITKAQANQTATPIETRTLGDLAASGTNLTVNQTCPTFFTDQYTYSVQNNTLNITSVTTKESFTFTLR